MFEDGEYAHANLGVRVGHTDRSEIRCTYGEQCTSMFSEDIDQGLRMHWGRGANRYTLDRAI